MSKKISLGVALTAVLAAVAITFAVTMWASQRIYNGVIKDLPQRSKMYENLSQIDLIIRENFCGEIDSELLKQKIQAGYASGLGDEYSRYMTPVEYKKYKSELQGENSAIGVDVYFDTKKNCAVIKNVFANSPALSSGLKAGDEIISIDNVKISSANYDELSDKLKNNNNESVTLVYLRNKIENTVVVPVGYNGEVIEFKSVGSNGYIKINMFCKNTAQQFKAVADKLVSDGAKSLIIDLRNSNSGTVEYAAATVDIAVPVPENGGFLASAVNSKGETTETFTSDSADISLPITVLVNENTSGAAELFACDLRDFGKAKLVGTKTHGNGTIQKVFELDNGDALLLTVALVKPYKSDIFDKIGLEPDYKVAGNYENGKDVVLEKAIAIFNASANK